MNRRLACSAAATVAAITAAASAHVPILSDGTAVDAAHAISLQDVQVSRVVYHEVTATAPQVWLTFQITTAQSLDVQLGVPFIDRLADYRPAVAILGPGLPTPPAGLPFSVPAGLGALVLDSTGVTSPEVFDEPFSGTRSWIVAHQRVNLPEAGQYYIVGYDPAGAPGKLWVALGTEERFTLDDIPGLPQALAEVRAFHEVAPRGGVPCVLMPAAALALAFGLLRTRRVQRC